MRELHTAVLVAVGVPCLVLHADSEDRLMGDLGGKYCCTIQTGLHVQHSTVTLISSR